MSTVKKMEDKDFIQVMETKKGIALIDFWAPWCAPCQMISPIIENIAGSYKDDLAVYKINTDENPEVSSKYKVTGIPTLVLFKDGKEIKRLVGYHSQDDIEELINSNLK
ncbi:MAG: thioredoxin [Elusimicrobiota bacterium]